ncbi:GNAT family N-acetyltransferase [Neobacillus terrae]|uniref:GNAT family N-acetyltransferase n=1 Tax=Neobacillus terrae TaxID=3034837 RepID=UPI00140DD82B|nr:GNAT family N-acetyltransferase [Neobacillus terrae]NHM31268.1 GNAT family N-acetyltransferase [Neobacillus terrae]
MEATIRIGTAEDAEQLITHTKKVLGENPQFFATSLEELTTTVEQEREWIKKQEKEGLLIVAETDGEIVGMLNFSPSTRKKFSHQGMFGMSIQEAYTNKGIGKKLITILLEWAIKQGKYEKISLEVFSNNPRAMHLYKTMGFEEEGRKKRHAKLGENQYADDIFITKFL